MPSNWLYVESQFPNFNGDETTQEKLEQLQNYLYMLVEQMRYTTQNLDLTNVNQTALNNWETALTRPIYAQIEGEGERITQLAATADGIQVTVQGQQEDIQDLQKGVEDQIQVIQEVQVAVGEQGGMITDIQGTVTAQAQQMAQLELTAQGLSATVQEQETKLTEFEGTLTAQGENIGTLEGTIKSQSEKLADLSLTADGLTTTVAEQTQTITQITGTVTGQGERLEQLGENLSEFTDTITGSLDELQAQLDGQIQTWFDREIPTPDNAPANTWESEEDKINHLGDLYYVVDNDTAGGQAYRWAKMDDTYQWVLIEDVEVAKALADAARAQDTADGKRRVFVTQPVPPYDVGDLWAQGDSGDLMRCNTARPMGIYLASDWGKASDYTNDDALHDFVDGTFAQTKEEVTKRLSQLEVKADSISATVSSQTTTITKLENTSLTGAVTEYYLSTSKTQLAGGSWSQTAPEWTEGKYMWSRTRTTRADGGTSYSSPTCIAGATGATGTGVSSITEEYYLSTSKTAQTGGSWTTMPPTWSSGKYIWTRNKIVYTNPASTKYTTPICDSSWEAVNEIEVGGRNLLSKKTIGLYKGGTTHPGELDNLSIDGYKISTTAKPLDIIGFISSNISGSEVVVSGFTDLAKINCYYQFRKEDNSTADIQKNLAVTVNNGKFKFGLSVPASASYVHIGLGQYPYVENYYIENVKLEIGNKATDWTPAPEDTQGEIDDLKDTTANQGQIIQTQESRLSDLEINTNAITATVQRVQSETQTSLDGVEQSLQELTEQVSLSLTSDQVNIAIEKKLSEGVETVKTSTGFTFDEEGLTVRKTGSEMSTKVTEDGMEVSQNNTPVLVADSQGVQATNLNANTYLIISGKARLEAYGTDRVACYWIGG